MNAQQICEIKVQIRIIKLRQIPTKVQYQVLTLLMKIPINLEANILI